MTTNHNRAADVIAHERKKAHAEQLQEERLASVLERARQTGLADMPAGLYYANHSTRLVAADESAMQIGRVWEKHELDGWSSYRGNGMPDMDAETAAMRYLQLAYDNGVLIRLEFADAAARASTTKVTDADILRALNAETPSAATDNLYDWTVTSQERMRRVLETMSSAPRTIDARDSLWVVTRTEQPALRDVQGDCEDCMALVPEAITHALVTGSRGASYRSEQHSVSVMRAVRVYATQDSTTIELARQAV